MNSEAQDTGALRNASPTPFHFMLAGTVLLALGSVLMYFSGETASAMLILGVLAGGVGIGVAFAGAWMRQYELEGKLDV